MLRYATIRSATTKVIARAGGTTIWTVNVNTGASGAILTIYNGTSASGDLVATVDASAVVSLAYGVYCPEGIFIELAGGAADITIGYA